MEAANTINIRPGVSILSVLKHLNYKPWFAIAEFVDNSLQSFLKHQEQLEAVEGDNIHLTVKIDVDADRIVIWDNAAGIYTDEYPRAFRPAAIPLDKSGLSEFGMGMKSAACWFSDFWTVKTTALGETVEREVAFDIEKIVQDDIEELSVGSHAVSADTHFTEITLSRLNQRPQTRTVSKIKEHLSSIYRVFLRSKLLELYFNGEKLAFLEARILKAPYYKSENGEDLKWRKDIDVDFGLGLRVFGFAAIREKASVSEAGFVLLRRNRLIVGGQDEGYRPAEIFGQPNDFVYQRLFGELHLEGFDVSHTKDGFRWKEYEEEFIDLLREELRACM